ncbi:unnamed protein product [Ranitomeya imitator]|uniref:ribonuclease H n=1 Tax=Ranitomeya imitator TaxID=111125 RepID=A0ABN9KN07_9NEOB|nr:unnamed protein product [Ranitomeya imitator]
MAAPTGYFCSAFTQYPTEQAKVAFIISHLKEDALAWVNIFWERDDPVVSQLSWNNEALVGISWRGLSGRIKDELAGCDNPTILEDVISLATRIDLRFQERARERRFPRPPPSSRRLPSPPLRSTSSVSAPEPMQVDRLKMSEQHRQERCTQGLASTVGVPPIFFVPVRNGQKTPPPKSVLLGLPWLRTHESTLDWHKGNILRWGDSYRARCLLPGRPVGFPSSPSIPSGLPFVYCSFLDVFEKKEAVNLPPHQPYNCPIDLVPGTAPPRGRIYSLSPAETQAMSEYVQENLARGFIQKSSPAGAGFFFVKKKDGSLRLCIDYRGLNNIMVKNKYPLPLIPELFDCLRVARIFTKLDLRGAFYLVRIRAGDEWKTTFNTCDGHYEYLVMPFDLCNAPAVFQEFVNDDFRDRLYSSVAVYLDDICSCFIGFSCLLEALRRRGSTSVPVIQNTGVDMDIQGLFSLMDNLAINVQNIQDLVVQNPMFSSLLALSPSDEMPRERSGSISRRLLVVEPSDCPGVDSVVDRPAADLDSCGGQFDVLSQERAQRFANRRVAIRFWARMPEAERRRLVQPSTEDTDSPVSDLVALSQRIHSSYMSTFTMTKEKSTGYSDWQDRKLFNDLMQYPLHHPFPLAFVIYDMETLWEAEKGTVWDQLPTQNPPGTEIGVHVFYRCQCTSVETVRALTDFAKSIPGFSTLYLNDQYGVHEAIFCMLASLMNKDGLLVAGGHGFVTREFLRSLRLPFCHIMEPKFNFASKFNALELNDSDLALFVAAIILCGVDVHIDLEEKNTNILELKLFCGESPLREGFLLVLHRLHADYLVHLSGRPPLYLHQEPMQVDRLRCSGTTSPGEMHSGSCFYCGSASPSSSCLSRNGQKTPPPKSGIGTFGSVDRWQVLLENEVSVSKKVGREKHEVL